MVLAEEDRGHFGRGDRPGMGAGTEGGGGAVEALGLPERVPLDGRSGDGDGSLSGAPYLAFLNRPALPMRRRARFAALSARTTYCRARATSSIAHNCTRRLQQCGWTGLPL
jgi:hypothetical protein